MSETDYIILKKIPFRETSLIVSGISPEFGRLDFLMRGQRSGKAGKFFLPGLFRELHLEFKCKKENTSALFSAGKMELITNFDSIAENIQGYFSACSLASMLLANTKPMIPVPAAYQALKSFLRAVQSGEKPEPYESLVYLTLLYESGELPPQEGRAGEFLASLLEIAGEGKSLPANIPGSYWEKLVEWRKVICRKMIP